MKIMVFDVGGTEIKYSVMDEQMHRTNSGAVPTPQDTQAQFLDAVYRLYAPHKDEVSGIAMALPGFVDNRTGYVSNGGALLYNTATPVGQLLAEKCGCPVILENDGKAAAMAELANGALKDCCNAAVFIIGTGVGGGIIANGQLVRGVHFTAGEYSFVNTNAEAWDAPDQNMACQCSTSNLLKWYRARKALPEDAPLDGRSFFAAANAGEPEALEVLRRFCHAVAVQIYNLTVLLDVEKVAIGGGISKQPLLLESLRVLKKGGVFVLHDNMKPQMYGDMNAFVEELRGMGFAEVQYVETAEKIFGSKQRAAMMMLGNSAMIVGRK